MEGRALTLSSAVYLRNWVAFWVLRPIFPKKRSMITTPVCIIGAGPGGAATALRLSYLGIPSVIIDKATFPRDKVCGDAISGKVTTLLNRLDPQILERFHQKAMQTDVWGVRFIAPNHRIVDIPFKPQYTRNFFQAPGYVAKRIDFDQFLIDELRLRPNIQLYTGEEITHFSRTSTGFEVQNETGSLRIQARLLIVANGAQSAFSRQYAGLEKDSAHHAGAVRAYYQGVTNMHPDNFIELHFIREITPGYFWIFPLPDGQANVGLGMRTDIIKRKKLNLRQAMQDIIENHPVISQRFKNATLIDPPVGYGLPLGSKTRTLSGDHFMLVGDAAHLVDPLTGEGIGNAVYSGFIAAEQAEQCLASEQFSATYLRSYDQRIARVLGSEMKLSYQMQQAGAYPWLLNIVANIISNNRKVLNYLSAMYTDFSLREQLVRPFFWIKLLWRR